MRRFNEWKAQLMNFLIRLKRDEDPFYDNLRDVVDKLDRLRSNWIASFLSDLYKFSKRWNVEIPEELLPTQEEIEEWMRRGD